MRKQSIWFMRRSRPFLCFVSHDFPQGLVYLLPGVGHSHGVEGPDHSVPPVPLLHQQLHSIVEGMLPAVLLPQEDRRPLSASTRSVLFPGGWQ